MYALIDHVIDPCGRRGDLQTLVNSLTVEGFVAAGGKNKLDLIQALGIPECTVSAA